MNAEAAYKFSRAYRFFFQGTFDITKYGINIKSAPLITQPDRRFYYRIAQKLDDNQIHALYTTAYFFKPNAYISNIATPEAFARALVFDARRENGRRVLENDLYELKKRLTDNEDLDEWLYGERLRNGRADIPGCLMDVIAGTLPIDVASLVLLIPQKTLSFNWSTFWTATDSEFGAAPWVSRLQKADRLIMRQRPGWRSMSHELAREFWTSLPVSSLAPLTQAAPATSLF